MKLSILDQAPISVGQTPQEALEDAKKLAQVGEQLGYERYWIAEHHDLPGLACSAPEVMLGYLGAATTSIRLGSGAVLLPHYKPYKVAEMYNMLATLFPGRIDVGIGRAPGGSAEATEALSDQFLQQVWKMPELIRDLLHFLHQGFTKDHRFSNVSAAPVPSIAPKAWLLGTSQKSAVLAAKNGLAYAFGQFMSDKDGKEIIRTYRNEFQPSQNAQEPSVILTVSVICAETIKKAHEVASSSLLWKLQLAKGEGKQGVPSIEQAINHSYTEEEKMELTKMKRNMIIGNPNEVYAKLRQLQNDYNADEIMLVTITHEIEDKLTSYRLIKQEESCPTK
ncbi:LLM class flavin-dependent oxidoreductase [Metabacillus iocasae]|uniref:Luciferase family oxidoreductase group 1 n=1 Tax=Priestia iocasae TaxID=2291674 RepID=A0ABS2QVV1_9BACI|nr:LLM class flavin-dependent oxidoreductase [Metabacillus iocasae]MBM7703596.1 luciferase family oxidoreductase group 1 [Metabacillus iocasae]